MREKAVIDTSKIYTLRNSYTAASKILAISSDGASLSMVDAHSVSPNALWFLTPTNRTHYYRLHTITYGVQRSLDVINDGVENINLHMADTGNYTGQYWGFDKWSVDQAYPYCLSNTFTGPARHLHVYSDTFVAHLADGNLSGQHWELSPAEAVVTHTYTPTYKD